MTPSDLARWDMALLHHRILGEKSYRDLTAEVRLKNGDLTHYALGLGVGEMDRIPKLQHTGEVTGFLTSNAVFPNRGAAVVVCTNQDSVFVFSSIAEQIEKWLLEPGSRVADRPAPAELSQVESIMDGLRHGRIDRSLLTPNLNGYFSTTALEDIRESLKPMGAVKKVVRTRADERGGMAFREYLVHLGKGTVKVTVYVTPAGLYEQFLIAQDI
jgi:CubicO group peptidase (beta-lactamase class C family)